MWISKSMKLNAHLIMKSEKEVYHGLAILCDEVIKLLSTPCGDLTEYVREKLPNWSFFRKRLIREYSWENNHDEIAGQQVVDVDVSAESEMDREGLDTEDESEEPMRPYLSEESLKMLSHHVTVYFSSTVYKLKLYECRFWTQKQARKRRQKQGEQEKDSGGN